MAGYLITDVEITDADRYADFIEKVTPVIKNHGGKFVARGGTVEVIEGDWNPPRLAILEFGSIEQAKEFLNSPEFNELNELRISSSSINMVVVEGV